ncbi:hypothetical protein DL89DRAFT_293695 [Linderina pennispora]|uniref:Fe2OG dioxygenase domain-containing protein n=1 Tax=Linderina pennispora TaxID=61395 RepID=A0A1Y1W6X2_9FUNG|nr:uncharacterized protein DL89DRAFT_293695 [Linderina pennispora]ORX69287.1 hypothetical protein DL89DRAFT_293695 [Linderina pennispora]
MADTQELFAELFGDASDGEGADSPDKIDNEFAHHDALLQLMNDSTFLGSASTPHIDEPVPGFKIHRNALHPALCTAFFNWLSAEYFPHTSTDTSAKRINQGMHFGAMTDASTPFGFLSRMCCEHPLLLPKEVRERPVLFDQAIINLYDPGEGIGDHIDLLRFGDGIAGFSFGAPALLRLRPVKDDDIERAARYADHDNGVVPGEVSAWIKPGDIYAMAGDARFRWSHGFPALHHSGDPVLDGRRISVTLRKLA